MRIGRRNAGHGTHLSYYDWGATPFFALQSDPRLSYCLYVPQDYDEHGSQRYPLVVLMHGTERGAARYRDLFADFAEAQGSVVLAPLFPCNLAGPGDMENYKMLEKAGIRFDLALLDMVDEVASRYRLAGDRFLLHGFSGGGHFTHRFLYLYPERLAAVSIGAPGVVTLFDSTQDWHVGIRGMGEVFGKSVDPAAVARVPVQCVIGAEDTDTWEITVPESSAVWRPGLNETGQTRVERLQNLADSLIDNGNAVRFDLVPGVAHDGWAVLEPVFAFFAAMLEQPEITV